MSDFDIARDELALDAIAAGRAPEHADDALSLLHALRTDLEPARVVPLRRRRAWPYVAVAAAAGLVLGVAASGEPGRPLYNVRRVVLGETHDPRAAQMTTLLDRAAGRLATGDRTGARRQLADAARVLPSVSSDDRAELRTRYDSLVALAAEPTPTPTPTPTPRRTPEAKHSSEPTEQEHESQTPSPTHSEGGDDHSGEGSGH